MADITPVLRRPDLVSDERLRRNIIDCLQCDAYCGPSVEKITQVDCRSTLAPTRSAAALVTQPPRPAA
jgi:hypothetical protein